jgi:hypothetical protein
LKVNNSILTVFFACSRSCRIDGYHRDGGLSTRLTALGEQALPDKDKEQSTKAKHFLAWHLARPHREFPIAILGVCFT